MEYDSEKCKRCLYDMKTRCVLKVKAREEKHWKSKKRSGVTPSKCKTVVVDSGLQTEKHETIYKIRSVDP